MPKISPLMKALATVPTGDSTYQVFCGIDWSENYHDYAIVDAGGKRRAAGRFSESLEGWHTLRDLLDEHGAGQPVPIVIETERGLLVDEARRTHHPIYAINPRAVHKYRERFGPSGAKTDRADALLMAHLGRTDLFLHRALPAETADMLAINQLARAHQDAAWRAQALANEIRSLLREFFPAALIAFPPRHLTSAAARTVLQAAPTPERAGRLSVTAIARLLTRAGRKRGIDREAQRLAEIFETAQMRRLPVVEQAMGETLRGLLRALDGEMGAVDALEASVVASLAAHPVHELVDSIPGLGYVTAARILGEIGDDHRRFHDAGSLKAYAGTSPVTVASGKSESVHFRYIRNSRLHSAAWQWAFMAVTHSAGARIRYDRRREAGDKHAAALRNVANRLLGCLHHCLRTGQIWDEKIIFGVGGRPPRKLTAEREEPPS